MGSDFLLLLMTCLEVGKGIQPGRSRGLDIIGVGN